MYIWIPCAASIKKINNTPTYLFCNPLHIENAGRPLISRVLLPLKNN